MKAVFDTRPDTSYDDDIFHRYHFPNEYLANAQKSVGDWIVYREPRRGGGQQGYVAVAYVERIEPDQSNAGHSYAHLTNFLKFNDVVLFQNEGKYRETWLNKINRSQIGRTIQGKSIRMISDSDFGAIALLGLNEALEATKLSHPAHEETQVDTSLPSLAGVPQEEKERRIIQMLVKRPLRDAAFRTSVVKAYGETCAVTGLRMINGGGRAEVQAAHIWSVQDGGPDIVQNGIALSATCHWLFDRHLISLTDNYGLLVSHNQIPSEMQNLFAKHLKRIHLPSDERLWPRRDFVFRHREKFTSYGQ